MPHSCPQGRNRQAWTVAEIVIDVSLPPSSGRGHDGRVISPNIVFAVFPGFQILDLTGPHEVFTQAGRLTGGVVITTVAAAPGPVPSSGGLAISPAQTIESAQL